MTSDPIPGWTIDRDPEEGRRYGFYARKDNGEYPVSLLPNAILPPVTAGANGSAIFSDSPGKSTFLLFGGLRNHRPGVYRRDVNMLEQRARARVLGLRVRNYKWLADDSDPSSAIVLAFDKAVEAWNAQNDPSDQIDLSLGRLGGP
jgi:hypothetical protein